MDLLSETSNEARVLAARHISADKAFSGLNNAINSTLLCHTYSLQPNFASYLAALQSYAWVLWSCGLLVLIAVCVLYVVTVRAALRHWRECILNVAVVLAVYPLVALAAFLAIILPRGRILAEAIAQEAVVIALYHLFSMIITECGGPDQLVRCSAGSRLQTRVLPCCCWPCCVLPQPKIRKRSLEWLRYLVLQVPIIQTIIYIIVLILWSEDMGLFLRTFGYIQPFVAASIISGMWGVTICVRAAEAIGRRPRPRFVALQLVLIIVKLQCGVAKILPDLMHIPCILPLHPAVFVSTIQYSLMLVEMLLISLWAWRLYRVPPQKTVDKVPNVVVAVLDDTRSLKSNTVIDGIDNKSYNNKCEL